MKACKRGLLILMTLALAVLLFAGCGKEPEAPVSLEAREVTVKVVHKDQTTKEFTYTSTAETLGDVLKAEGLVQGKEDTYGLFVQTVDGETVDESKQEWWCLTKGGEAVMTGVDSTPFEAGDTFELTFTVGY